VTWRNLDADILEEFSDFSASRELLTFQTYCDKLAQKKQYHASYFRMRYATDPEFRAAHLAYRKRRRAELARDPAHKAKEAARHREYRLRKSTKSGTVASR
jgi:uncharacterized membrane protein YgaE (UPF0421/DUF939 family)